MRVLAMMLIMCGSAPPAGARYFLGAYMGLAAVSPGQRAAHRAMR